MFQLNRIQQTVLTEAKSQSSELMFEGLRQPLPLGWQHRTCSVKLSVEPGVWEEEVHRFFEACPAILSLCKHLAENKTSPKYT